MAESSKDASRNLTINVGAKDTTGDTFKKVADKAKSELGRLDQLKNVLGEDSAFGKSMKLLSGAGAVAGFTMAGRALAEVTAKAVELRDAFRDGAGASEITAELLKSIPLIGEFAKAGANIRELFTGERAQIERLTKEAEATNRYVDERRKTETVTRDILREQADYYAEMRGQYNMVGLSGVDRSAAANQHAADKDIRDIVAKGAEAKAKRGGELKDEERDILKQLADVNKGDGTAEMWSSLLGSTYGMMDDSQRRAGAEAELNRRLEMNRREQGAFGARIDAGTQRNITGRGQLAARVESDLYAKDKAEREKKAAEDEADRVKAEAAAREAAERRKEQTDRAEGDRRRVVREFAMKGFEGYQDVLGAAINPWQMGGGITGAMRRANNKIQTESPDVVKELQALYRLMQQQQSTTYQGR